MRGGLAWALTAGYLALTAVRLGLSARHWRLAESLAEPTETAASGVSSYAGGEIPASAGMTEGVPAGVAEGASAGVTQGASAGTTEKAPAGMTDRASAGVTASDDGMITVLQPILSGDPGLPEVLAANLRNHPEARFCWLVDVDDAEGRAITERLAGAAERVRVVLCPPCPELTNPKVFKLVLGLHGCETELVAVLDDDTELPPGALTRARAALTDADLATGLPWYRPGGGPWSALVAGFVNGNALISYFALPGEPLSINGMFYLTSRTALARAGGFESILDRVCDDLELARRFRSAGLRLAQTTITHPVATEIRDATAYRRLMHRWLVFARRLGTTSATPALTLLVLLPSALPLAALTAAALAGSGAAVAAAAASVAVKVLAGQRLRAALTPEVPRRFVAEYLADWLLPVQAAAASVLPGRIEWRGRRLRIVDGALR